METAGENSRAGVEEVMKISLWLKNKEFRLNLEEQKKNTLWVTLGEREYRILVEFISPDELLLHINNRVYDVIVNTNTSGFFVHLNGRSYTVEKKSASQILGKQTAKQKKRDIKTSMPGRIVKVFLKKGDKVKEGQAVLILEAMKMENEIKSPQSGVITRLDPKPGDHIETGAVLFSVE